ncbi:hypothetical protein [Frankia sp. EAN1pec]|uniref:hypothetical protein n=1 Tax=Parafrankia sp. (strain EAN1pec) TaxID=298653 RepID=UPI0012F81ED3
MLLESVTTIRPAACGKISDIGGATRILAKKLLATLPVGATLMLAGCGGAGEDYHLPDVQQGYEFAQGMNYPQGDNSAFNYCPDSYAIVLGSTRGIGTPDQDSFMHGCELWRNDKEYPE